MCTDHHDGTCTGILSRSKTQAGHLTMKLICESCNEVIRTLGSVEYTLNPVLGVTSPDVGQAA
jgi:hypothetical protein